MRKGGHAQRWPCVKVATAKGAGQLTRVIRAALVVNYKTFVIVALK